MGWRAFSEVSIDGDRRRTKVEIPASIQSTHPSHTHSFIHHSCHFIFHGKGKNSVDWNRRIKVRRNCMAWHSLEDFVRHRKFGNLDLDLGTGCNLDQSFGLKGKIKSSPDTDPVWFSYCGFYRVLDLQVAHVGKLNWNRDFLVEKNKTIFWFNISLTNEIKASWLWFIQLAIAIIWFKIKENEFDVKKKNKYFGQLILDYFSAHPNRFVFFGPLASAHHKWYLIFHPKNLLLSISFVFFDFLATDQFQSILNRNITMSPTKHQQEVEEEKKGLGKSGFFKHFLRVLCGFVKIWKNSVSISTGILEKTKKKDNWGELN